MDRKNIIDVEKMVKIDISNLKKLLRLRVDYIYDKFIEDSEMDDENSLEYFIERVEEFISDFRYELKYFKNINDDILRIPEEYISKEYLESLFKKYMIKDSE